MAKNIGTLVGAPIRINDNNDTYPSAYASEIKGGHKTVANLTALFALSSKPDQLEENVTVVTVIDDGVGKRDYILVDDTNINNPTGWELYFKDLYLPDADKNQQLFATGVRNKYIASNQLLEGNFIRNTDELNRALSNGEASQEAIFTQFKRFCHGGATAENPASGALSNDIPGYPVQTNSWNYDGTTNIINSTFNTGTAIGFFSNDRFDTYVHTTTLTAGTAANDNDRIGLVLAFFEDTNDMVPNKALGLNPADYNWPLDVTSTLIPNQHVITLYRNRNGASTSYFVQYNLGKLDSQVVLDGSNLPGLFHTGDPWSDSVTVDVKVVRTGDVFTIQTTDYSDAPGGKGALRFDLTLDLNSNPLLYKFKGKQSYGYSCHSQALAKFENIQFSGSNNVIYDLRDGSVHIFNGGYIVDPTRNFYDEVGVCRLLYNPIEDTEIWISRDQTVHLLNPKFTLDIEGAPTLVNEAAAVVAGLAPYTLYKTPTGELRYKLPPSSNTSFTYTLGFNLA